MIVIINKLINLSLSKKSTPFHLACSKGDIDQLRKLVEKENIDPMKPDSTGTFPLHIAVISNKIECARLLLNKYGCSPNSLDKNNMTALHHACLFGYVDVVRLLIDHPDIDLVSCLSNFNYNSFNGLAINF